jgi:hypothetical protein
VPLWLVPPTPHVTSVQGAAASATKSTTRNVQLKVKRERSTRKGTLDNAAHPFVYLIISESGQFHGLTKLYIGQLLIEIYHLSNHCRVNQT